MNSPRGALVRMTATVRVRRILISLLHLLAGIVDLWNWIISQHGGSR